MLKFSGIFLTVLSTALFQLMLRVFLELIYCDRDFEVSYGCDAKIRTVATYFAIIGIIFMTALILYADMFINK